MPTTEGGCMCGAVRFVATVPDRFGACTCKMCQRWSSGRFMGVHTAAFEYTEGEDRVTVYRSSGWAERAFCSVCGSNLYYRALASGTPSVALGTLDDTSGMHVARQWYVDRAAPGTALADRTGMMTEAETIAHFAGSDDDD